MKKPVVLAAILLAPLVVMRAWPGPGPGPAVASPHHVTARPRRAREAKPADIPREAAADVALDPPPLPEGRAAEVPSAEAVSADVNSASPGRVDLARVEADIRREEERRTLVEWRDRLWAVYRDHGVDAETIAQMQEIGRDYAEGIQRILDQMRDPEVPLVDLRHEGAFDPLRDLAGETVSRLTTLLGPSASAAVDAERARFAEEDGGRLLAEPAREPLVYVPAD